MRIASICTISTKECVSELALFLRCIRRHHPKVPIHIRTDAITKKKSEDIFRYLSTGTYHVSTENIHFTSGLEAYGTIDRKLMERTPGKFFRTLHEDFMLEKATVLQEALDAHKSALFLDCDIAFLRPLESLEKPLSESQSKWVMLSPHSIKEEDEALFGRFNGGWLATNDADVPRRWREYTQTSRYFDQAALEHFTKESDLKVEHAPVQSNFGYWRLFQAKYPSQVIQSFKLEKDPEWNSSKIICYDCKPLQSVHSHLCMPHLCGAHAECFNMIIERLCNVSGKNYTYLLDAMKNPFRFDFV